MILLDTKRELSCFLKTKFLFSLIILLVTCPLWGQVNNNFKAHVEGNKVFFALNDAVLNKEMLFVRHGTGYKQVIWSRYEDSILLEIPNIKSLSGTIIPINNNPLSENSIVATFPIIKEKSDAKTHYIDVTNLFLQNSVEWFAGFKDSTTADLTLIDEVQELNNEVVVTTKRVISKNVGISKTTLHFSFFILPSPMDPRLFDHRMGFFVEDQSSYINHYPQSKKGNISRWHLEKKYKDKKISEPVQPITFYYASNMPDKWKPYVKAGVEEWLPAFEAAGYKNAILIKEPPVDAANWNIHSVNNSVIRWSNKEGIRGFEEADGSTVNKIIDFRTGEILKSDIIFAGSYLSLAQEYIVRCAPLDKRSQQYPLPDDLIGELIQFKVAHEAGHAFGIRDANYGEYAYPFDKMRDADWLKKMGHTPSVMTYARHNYIPQPEDNISPSLLIQKVGPTDVYQIKWGYQKFDNIKKPDDERPFLEKLIRQQDTIPWYRYNIGQREKIGPDSSDEVVDNNNPIKSTILGLKNMKRVIALLPKITKNEKDNELLKQLYYKTITLWFNEMKQVMALIGGYTIQYKSGAQEGAVYDQIPVEIQEDAMTFLLSNAFEAPKWLSTPHFSDRIQYSTYQDKLLENQIKLLSVLLNPRRMKRIEQIDISQKENNLINKLFLKIQEGLFSELMDDTISIEYRRQEIQKAYISLLLSVIKEQKNNKNVLVDNYYLYSEYSKNVFLSELLSIKKRISNSLNNIGDTITRAHLIHCMLRIDSI